MIKHDTLHEMFEYKDGNLYRKLTTSTNAKQGDVVGTICNKYLVVTIKKKPYKLHRIIFYMHFGYLPKILDHVDGDTRNNRIENLRSATNQENQRNKKQHKNNSSGYKNVTFNARNKKWQVGLMINKRYKYFGLFEDIELADLVATEARNKYFGEFARHF